MQQLSLLASEIWGYLDSLLTPLGVYFDAHPNMRSIALLLVGALVAEIFSAIKAQFTAHKELKQNNKIYVAGKDWFVAWQASTDNVPNINTESIVIRQKGAKVFMHNVERSPENPKGGYLWRAVLEFSFGETLMGWYHPIRKENITSRGIMYFTYDSQRRLFLGKWVGKAIDGPLCHGYAVISKNRDVSRECVKALIERSHEHPVNVITTNLWLPESPAVVPPIEDKSSDIQR